MNDTLLRCVAQEHRRYRASETRDKAFRVSGSWIAGFAEENIADLCPIHQKTRYRGVDLRPPASGKTIKTIERLAAALLR
jgi:hypothetical protein